jgi:hypothetical protein
MAPISVPRRLAIPVKFQLRNTFMHRFRISLLAVMCVLLFLRDPAAAQTDPGPRTTSETFLVRLCNYHSEQIFVALIIRPDSTQRQDWVVRGWWRVASQQCVNAARSLYGYIYAYAEAKDGNRWPPDDYKHDGAIGACVEYPGPFRRVRKSGYTCRPTLLKRFWATEVRENFSIRTIEYHPGKR